MINYIMNEYYLAFILSTIDSEIGEIEIEKSLKVNKYLHSAQQKDAHKFCLLSHAMLDLNKRMERVNRKCRYISQHYRSLCK